MARMMGKREWHQACGYGCCRYPIAKHSVRRMEEREWTAEVEREQDDE